MIETITYDITIRGEWVKPGSRIKIKGRWKTYTYLHVLCLGTLDDAWVVCEDLKGNRERFKPGQIKRVVGKRSRNNV